MRKLAAGLENFAGAGVDLLGGAADAAIEGAQAERNPHGHHGADRPRTEADPKDGPAAAGEQAERGGLRGIDVVRASVGKFADSVFDVIAGLHQFAVGPLEFLVAVDEGRDGGGVGGPFGGKLLAQRRRHRQPLRFVGEFLDAGFDLVEIRHVAAEQVILLMAADHEHEDGELGVPEVLVLRFDVVHGRAQLSLQPDVGLKATPHHELVHAFEAGGVSVGAGTDLAGGLVARSVGRDGLQRGHVGLHGADARLEERDDFLVLAVDETLVVDARHRDLLVGGLCGLILGDELLHEAGAGLLGLVGFQIAEHRAHADQGEHGAEAQPDFLVNIHGGVEIGGRRG